MSEWLPIGTAPKDGTLVLAWFDGAEPAPVVVRYVDGSDQYKWANQDHLDGQYHEDFVTHWMPLPEAPSGQTVSGSYS